MPNRRAILTGGATLVGSTLAGAVLLPGIALAEKLEIYVTSEGVAINGYDPVAYFLEENHVEGSAQFKANWKRADWYFSSAENRDLFEASPEEYAPQYGGYCAFAVAFGSIATTVPEAWTIYKGKLYLNFSLGVRRRWRQDPDRFIELADNNWPGVLG